MRIAKGLRTSLLAVLLSASTLTAAHAVTLPAIFAGGEVGQGIYIDAPYLEELASTSTVKIIDIRAPEAYAAGHITGAINIPTPVISIEANGLRNEIPETAVLQDVFAKAGLSYDDTIVLYGDDLAGRAFIAFDQSGFEHIHILENGLANWTGATTDVASVPTASNFVLDRAKAEIVDKEYVLSKLEQPGVFIIDSRDTDSYNKGFIPGSFNVPISVSHNKAALNDPEALVAAFDAIGVKKDSEIITTCGSGNVASNQLAALRDLGYTNIKLYDGSWGDWSADPSTPKGQKG
ncbi:rhodanese-like domain-containing protein [Devosia sp. 2618]|uniref:sulfurtransferase n=1 Tax=Devosia sp. 2618 TaxID=3156454 RepID=UPI0033918322